MSFNLNYSGLTLAKEIDGLIGSEITSPPPVSGQLISSGDPYAFLFEWSEYYSPKALFLLQKTGLKTRVSMESFAYDDGVLKKSFSAGTIVIPASGQTIYGQELRSLMEKTAKECGITIYGVRTGLTNEGIDLGSNRIVVLSKPSVAMVTGEGANSADAGEIWHLLDTRFTVPVTMITAQRFNTADLTKYNVLIITGSPDISPAGLDNIRAWNRSGGIIIGYKTGNRWLARNKFAEIEFIEETGDGKDDGIYLNRAADRQVRQIPGSIFETHLDLTHPLCFGYTRDALPVFKSTATAVRKVADIYNNPVQYTEDPLLSGYCTGNNISRIKGTSFASVHENRVISFYDNTNFRAFWYGTNKIFLNAIFFGQVIR